MDEGASSHMDHCGSVYEEEPMKIAAAFRIWFRSPAFATYHPLQLEIKFI